MLQRLWKPWFVYRPLQLWRRVRAALRRSRRGYQPLATSWGAEVWADPTKAIGRSIVTTGVYDLAVSEILARFVEPGDVAIDAGANVGYMTLLMSVAAGPEGRVLAFEPHPELFKILERTMAHAREGRHVAAAELHNLALGDHNGAADLCLPRGFDGNDGMARIAVPGGADPESVTVPMATLDDIVGNRSVAVLKLDVEGHEAQVLRGGRRLLESRRIRHIVFEEHDLDASDALAILRGAGYHIHALGWSMRGPQLVPVEAGRMARAYEAPSFVASLEPAQALARAQRRGWSVLSKRFAARSESVPVAPRVLPSHAG
jgi:FkbM family methyltransferase